MFSTTIEDVRARTVNRKSDGKEITIYEVIDADGRKWSTTFKKLATQANGLLGETVLIEGRIERNGEFLNHYLESVQPDTAAAMHTTEASMHVPGGGRVDPRAEIKRVEARQLPEPQKPSDGPSDRDWNIWRQTAAKVSAQISESPAEFWHNIDDLIVYFATGQKPDFIPGLPSADDELTGVISGDPGREEGIPYAGDDDIPF